eukprot:GFUD01008523.1.p1 GENE.GFUD01008523.1~~GFUD01008523.1.p1  ORF type:complete len:424 (-),score=71.80 GFUD01008523.1:63-1334(-)
MKNLVLQVYVTFEVIHSAMSLPNWISPEEYLLLKSAEAETTIGIRTGNGDLRNQCNLNQQCILLSRCRKECSNVNKGLLQTDRKFQQHLLDVFCGLSSGHVKVCCSRDSISEEAHCSDLAEDEMTNSTCGERFSRDSFITGGNITNPGEWPWMARLLYGLPDETSRQVTYCGGTLISRRHVVTAAHCITEDIKPVAVAFGDSDVTTDYDCLDVKSGRGCSTTGAACTVEEECAPKHVEIRIKDIITHEKYKFDNCIGCIPKFDVALIVLEEPVEFTDFIQPVCLPKPNKQSQGPLTVTGWGNTIAGSQRGKTAANLQELNVKEVPLSECKAIWKPKLKEDLISTHLCASTGVVGSTSCKGDSGGPLVRNSNFQKQIWELAGVVSFGISTCGNEDFPLGFTRVEGEVNLWLREIVGRELPKHPK